MIQSIKRGKAHRLANVAHFFHASGSVLSLDNLRYHNSGVKYQLKLLQGRNKRWLVQSTVQSGQSVVTTSDIYNQNITVNGGLNNDRDAT
jgi:hypothetical protein